MRRAYLRALHACPPGRVFYRVPWWGRHRLQARLALTREGETARAHWLMFGPTDFRPVVDKVLVIDGSARIVEFRIGIRRTVSNDRGTSLAYEHALEFAEFCLEIRRRYEV